MTRTLTLFAVFLVTACSSDLESGPHAAIDAMVAEMSDHAAVQAGQTDVNASAAAEESRSRS